MSVPSAAVKDEERIRGRSAMALGVVVGFWALVLIDEIVVNITVARIGEDLSLTPTGMAWILNAYLLPFGGLLLLGGRAGDILGRRRVFLAGLALYTTASLLRGIAPDAWTLGAARTLQGAGAALATPAVLALIMHTFAEGPLRRRAVGIYTIAGSVGTALGLLVVGVLGSVGSWRLVLLMNVPVGVLLLVLGAAVLEETPRRSGRFDFTGALTSSLGVAALVYALASSQEGGWRTPRVLGFFAAGLVLLAAFVAATRRSRDPILPLGLFADRSRVSAYLVLLLVQGTQIGQIFFLSQYFQLVLDFGPMRVAVAFLPVAGGIVGTAWLAVRLQPVLGAKTVIVGGAALLAGANLWLVRLEVGDPYATAVLPSLLLVGAGLALVAIPATVLATDRIRDDTTGAAAGVVNAVQTVGSSLSLAVIVAVATTASADAAAAPPPGLPEEALPGYIFAAAMEAAFLVGLGFAVATALAALLARRARS